MNRKHFEKWLVSHFCDLGIASIMTVLEKNFCDGDMPKEYNDSKKAYCREVIDTLYKCSITNKLLWNDDMRHTASATKNIVLDYLNLPLIGGITRIKKTL